MKTTFVKLFTMIAVALILAGGSLRTVSAQGRLIGLVEEVLNEAQHHHNHQHGHNFGHNYGPYNGQQFNGGNPYQYQPPQQQYSPPPVNQLAQRPVQSSLPTWLVGKWQLLDGRVGGTTQYEITADGRFTTISLVTGTAAGTYESGRSTLSASYSPNGLIVGQKLFQVSSTEAGKLTLNSNGSSFQIQRIDAPVNGGAVNGGAVQPVVNNTPVVNNPQPSGDGSRVPVAMQGTWYEIARNSRGEQILNRYIFSPDGTYDLLQYAISAEGDVDLGQPLAQLSKLATAQQRTVSITQQAEMTLAAGQRFAEGPMQLASEVDSNGQVTVLHMGDRKLTRQP